MTIHVVTPGETVAAIAANYGVDPARLAADNSVGPEGRLAVGQTLVVRLPRQIHAVSPGETLTSVASSYGVSVRQLWRNNWPLGGGEALIPGQDLVISYFNEKIGTGLFNGYAYPYIDPSLLSAQLPYLTHLSPFTYGIQENGSLLPLDDGAMLAAARRIGTSPALHLSTLTESGQFDTARGALVLTDFTVQERLIEDVMETVQAKEYAGVDVDFEYLPGELAAAYGGFLSRLRARLHQEGRFLWTALAPKTSAQQKGLLYEGHDYAAVSAASDAVLLMTYEWGYTYNPWSYKLISLVLFN